MKLLPHWMRQALFATAAMNILGAAGKLSFFALLAGYCAAGVLPLRAPLAGGADLVFGVLFVVWLAQTRGET